RARGRPRLANSARVPAVLVARCGDMSARHRHGIRRSPMTKPGRALLLVFALANVAHAEADKAAAERYFRAGAKAYAAQNFAAAEQDFEEAWKHLPMPEIAFSAAQAYRRLYRVDPKAQYVRRAVDLYKAYLDKVKSGGRVGDAADNLAEMERELDKLKAL